MKKSKNVIVVEKLVKKFGKFTALDGLDLTVKKGEVHGFLGPNGSGKSTTIRIILGLLKKTSGKVSLLGHEPWGKSSELHRRLAYVPGEVNLWPNLSGGEAIDLLGDLRGGLDENKLQDLLARFNLDPTKKFRTYSKGNRQKVALVAALASDVELYVLDEPTSGLDPLMEAVFQDYVNELKDQGKTVLLSSHILAEVEVLCDKVTIIREGKTVETGTLGDIQRLQRTNFSVETKKSALPIAKLKGVHEFNEVKGRTTFEVESKHLNDVVKKLSALQVTHVTSHPPRLEELFLRHYDKQSDNPED
ncbi:MAG: ABC transporter ATP-binding protein [Candidatus Saccharimonadales bacterium]|nr:ABC transporter ATP-binding protein [Candidatus Saccharimonadales bacterium]